MQSVKEHSTRLSRNSINYATVEKVSKKAEKVRAIPAPWAGGLRVQHSLRRCSVKYKPVRKTRGLVNILRKERHAVRGKKFRAAFLIELVELRIGHTVAHDLVPDRAHCRDIVRRIGSYVNFHKTFREAHAESTSARRSSPTA